eukprot:4672081-Amphidinium_carterae.1
MDLPPPEQRAEFSGTNAILLCFTNRVIEHPTVQEQGSRASDEARRARFQREKEEWAVKHMDRYQSTSHGSSDRSQSYTPYKWENESHGHWSRSWEERGWRDRPYHHNITWRADEKSQEDEKKDEKNKERQDVQGMSVSIPVKAAPKTTSRSNQPVPPVVPPVTGPAVPVVPVQVQTPVQPAHAELDTDE